MLSHAEYAKHDAKLDAGVTVSDAYHMRNTKLRFVSLRSRSFVSSLSSLRITTRHRRLRAVGGISRDLGALNFDKFEMKPT